MSSVRELKIALLAGVVLSLLATSLAINPSGAQAGGGCKPAYYRYTERGTEQYVKAFRIGNRHVKCRQARELGKAYGRAYRHNYGTPDHLLGFRCEWTRIGSDVGFAECERGRRQSVRFNIYDSSPFH